ncbi:MAG: MFS transporter [Candidatus Thermoplasmatota archaeon]|nr:MFS transporter [Candidatus Thermoplasmatota archaeon]
MKLSTLNLGLLRNKYVGTITIVQLIRILGRSQAWIFVPLYLANIRGVPYVVVGLLFFATAMITLPFSIYGGNFIDRIGRRIAAVWLPPILIVLFMTIATVIYFRLPDYILFATFLLVEPFTTIQGILDNVVITDTTSESERTDAFSLTRIGGNVGFSIGPALGGILSLFNYSYVFLVPGILTVLEWFLYLRYITETKQPSAKSMRKLQFPSSDRPFVILCILIASVWFVAGQWGTTLTLFWSRVDNISNTTIGLLYAVNGIAVVFLQIPTNWLFSRVKDYKRIAVGGLVYAFSFFALAFSSNILFLLVDVIFITIGENILSPVAYSIIGKMAPAEKRGQYYGAFQLIIGLVMPIAPVIGTILLTSFSGNPLMMWGPLMILGVVISAIMMKFGNLEFIKDRRESTTTKI